MHITISLLNHNLSRCSRNSHCACFAAEDAFRANDATREISPGVVAARGFVHGRFPLPYLPVAAGAYDHIRVRDHDKTGDGACVCRDTGDDLAGVRGIHFQHSGIIPRNKGQIIRREFKGGHVPGDTLDPAKGLSPREAEKPDRTVFFPAGKHLTVMRHGKSTDLAAVLIVRSRRPSIISQSRIVVSLLPLASTRPSGEMAHAVTTLVCPSIIRRREPSGTCQHRTFPSQPPDTRRDPSGPKAMHRVVWFSPSQEPSMLPSFVVQNRRVRSPPAQARDRAIRAGASACTVVVNMSRVVMRLPSCRGNHPDRPVGDPGKDHCTVRRARQTGNLPGFACHGPGQEHTYP